MKELTNEMNESKLLAEKSLEFKEDGTLRILSK